MNDRFKFRVWNKEEKKMCEAEGVYGYTDESTKGGEVFVKGYNKSFYFPEEVEVMQSTGLKDVEGNLIYEGDVIVIPNEYPFYDENVLNYVGVVEYIYNSWQYVYHCVNPKKVGISDGMNYLLNEDGIEENENSYFEVIGNIYENKEILDGNRN